MEVAVTTSEQQELGTLAPKSVRGLTFAEEVQRNTVVVSPPEHSAAIFLSDGMRGCS